MKSRSITKPLAACGAVAALTLGSFALATPANAATTTTSPKNVILLIGDGMGYNHLDNMNAYQNGEVFWQVDRGGDHKVKPWGGNATPTEGFQTWDRVAQETTWYEQTPYDTNTAWTDFESLKNNPTDSAAASTAMATGYKTYNAAIGVDYNQNVVENVSERADALGKSAGVVSSVPFSHATPAGFSSHNINRNDYHGIAAEQVDSDYLDVVMGAGHPYYTDDAQPRTGDADFTYISEESYNKLANGETGYKFIENDADFEALTTGDTPERVFGIPHVASTLQQARTDEATPNNVVSLATMTEGALNVLDNNENGFFLMVEGGAIDWAGHANQTQRDIDETISFSEAVDSVVNWVETNSSWDETLVIVTADHETGYLNGATYKTDADGNPLPLDGDANYKQGDWGPMVPGAAGTAASQAWFSPNHTSMLVPYFAKGAGADTLLATATGHDLVRGNYLANTSMANWLLNDAWVVPTNVPGNTTAPTTAPAQPGTANNTTSPSLAAGKGSNTSNNADKAGALAHTGADAFGVIAITTAALLLAGAATLIIRRRGQGA